MSRRLSMLIAGTAGAIWALAVVWVPGLGTQPFIPLNLALVYAFLPAGLFLAILIGWIALRRFTTEDLHDGQKPLPGTAADIDRRVLQNTLEQVLLALLLWPFIALSLGSVTIIALGLSFGFTRCAFWAGYRWAPPLRMFGFAAGFYPTVFGTLWALWRLVT